LTHAEPHPAKPGWHAHFPLTQVSFAPQVTPHAPQSAGLFPMLTQVPSQSVYPIGHGHFPLTQASFAGQTTPHEPQFFESLVTSTHVRSPALSVGQHARFISPAEVQ
jgi:hypothetical protein